MARIRSNMVKFRLNMAVLGQIWSNRVILEVHYPGYTTLPTYPGDRAA